MLSRLPLSPVIFSVITVILFAAEYFFQASKQSALIFNSSRRTLEKLRSQKVELVTRRKANFPCSRHFSIAWQCILLHHAIFQVALRDEANCGSLSRNATFQQGMVFRDRGKKFTREKNEPKREICTICHALTSDSSFSPQQTNFKYN